jgi:hypothetical protein
LKQVGIYTVQTVINAINLMKKTINKIKKTGDIKMKIKIEKKSLIIEIMNTKIIFNHRGARWSEARIHGIKYEMLGNRFCRIIKRC